MLKMLCVPFLILLLTNALLHGIDAENLLIEDDDYHELKTYKPYNESIELSIKCREGNNVIVIVDKLDVDLNDRDYLVIKSGDQLEDDLPGLVLTAKLKAKRQYVIGNNKVYFYFELNGNNTNKLDGFVLRYKCDGNVITTTPTPATTIDLPVSVDVDNNYTAYVYNYNFAIDNFRNTVKDMAHNYCNMQNISLIEKITVNNIVINRVDKCPYNWPEEDRCIKIKFAVPVVLSDPNAEYQLMAQHLAIMWQRTGNEYLEKFNMTVYKLYNVNDPTKWIVTASIILLLLTILLVLAKYLSEKIQIKYGGLQNENGQSKQKEDEKRISGNLLHPHPFQVIPVERQASYFEVNLRRDTDT